MNSDSTNIRAVVFDLDGTLVDSRVAIIDAVSAGVREVALEEGYDDLQIDPAILRGALGKPAPEYFQSILPEKLRDSWLRVKTASTRHEVDAFKRGDGKLYDGVLEALDALAARGILLASVSNAQAPYFRAALHYGQLESRFDYTECHEELPEDVGPPFKQALLQRALLALDVTAEQAVMVGDRAEDLEAGHALGCKAIGIPFGFGSTEEMRLADAVLESFAALPEVVAGLESTKD